jgi:sugar/nucleoside kinase (ribokinase family)
MYDVLCLGILTSCDIIFSGLKEMPAEGREIFCKELKIRSGGCANTPVALAKLGVSTTLLTRIGNDTFGRIIYGMMESSGLDMSEVILDDDYRTCVSAVLSTERNRGFATYYDSGKKLSGEIIKNAISKCNYVFSDLGTCLELPSIITNVKRYNKKLLIDTGWLENMELSSIAHILENVEVFSPNDMEACRITGTDDIEDALDILSKYVDIAVIKLGRHGSIAKKGDKIFRVPARNEFVEVDTTGAGDLFNAGFIFGYLKGWDIQRCLKMGNLTGGFSISFIGGMDDSFTYENISRYMDF